MIASRYDHQEICSTHRDKVEVEIKNELERIFYPRGIFVENVLLHDINHVSGGAPSERGGKEKDKVDHEDEE
jgi:hypothetical protein